MEARTIDLGGGYRLRRFDARNWMLQQWREPDPSNGRAKTSEPSWRDTGNFFQSLGPALAFVFERRVRDEGAPDESLADAIDRVEAIRDELMAVR